MKNTSHKSFLSILRLTALLEGLSLLILLGIAMPLKYYFEKPEAVQIVGMAHGILFIIYILLIPIAHVKLKWKLINTGFALLASIIPFGTFVADKKIFK